MAADEEPICYILFNPIFNDDRDLPNNQCAMIYIGVTYVRAPEDEDEVVLENLETRTVDEILEVDKEWLIGGEMDQIQSNVNYILDLIDAPLCDEVVARLTDEILFLKDDIELRPLLNLESVTIDIEVLVRNFPYEDDGVVDVRFAVAPATDEAVEEHLETVIIRNESYCAICTDNIGTGADEEAVRMPCLHVFHRTCGVAWLRNSGVCPLCRAVFPA